MEPMKIARPKPGEEMAALSKAVDKAEPGQKIVYCETFDYLPQGLRCAADALHARGMVLLVQKPTGPSHDHRRRWQYMMVKRKQPCTLRS